MAHDEKSPCNLTFTEQEKYKIMGIFLLFIIIVFGFGYFFGRFEQIQRNKALLQPIADVNPGNKSNLYKEK